ncbi:MAG: hypothetical protein AAF830_07500 [Pseudomonadota bacterium]
MRLASLFICLLTATTAAAQDDWPELKGPYLGQELPGAEPVVFAPGLISLEGERELNSVFSPDGRIFMFSRTIDGVFKMFYTRQRDDGTWQEPRLAAPSKTYPGHHDVDMVFAPDAEWLYFISDRPLPGYSLERYNIWRTRFTEHGLTTPEPLGAHINGPGHELYPMIVGDGSLYFSAVRDDTVGARDTYRAQYKDGVFEDPVNIGPGVNSEDDEGDIYVNPDESYLIHVSASRKDSLGGADLYISFKQEDGTWGDDIHMGPKINSEETDYCPMVSPDGRVFFYTQGNDIMWMDAAVIETFRK